MKQLEQMLRPWAAHRLLLIVLAVFAIGLVAAACGDDEEDDQAQPSTEQQAPADEQSAASGALKIGYLADFSGPLAEFGPEIQKGVELAIKHINDAGGVLGQPVQLVVGDDQTDPTAASEEARRLVDVEGAHAIVGPLASGVAIAVAESVTGPAGIPTVTPSATSPSVSNANDNGFLFRSTTSDAAQGPILAQLAVDQGLDNVAVVFINDAYGQGLSESFANAFEGTVTSVSIEDGATSYLAELQRAAEGGADTLVAISFPTQAEIYMREALENEIFANFLFVDGTKSVDLPTAIGAENVEGMQGTAPSGGQETDASAAFEAAYIAEHGAVSNLPFVKEAYDAVIAIALAAEQAGSTDGAAIRDALPAVGAPEGAVVIPGPEGIAQALEAVRNGEDINYEGAATTVDWNDVGDVTTGFIEIWQYQDGQPVTLETIAFDLG